MNLKEVLDYRTHCLICNRKLEIKSVDLADVYFHMTNDGLLVETGTKDKDYSVFFKYDGTYDKMKRWNDMYVKPLSIFKECPKCVPAVKPTTPENSLWSTSGKNIIIKGRSAGATTMTAAYTSFWASTLGSLKSLRCAYAFDLFGDSEGNFTCSLNWEDIMYKNKTSFYHVKTSFKEDRTQINTGKFKETWENILSLDLPAFKSNYIKDTNKLIEKIKLFNTFS